jgi:hypothetical protein
MRNRFIELVLVAVAIVGVTMLLKLVPTSSAGQVPAATAEAGPAPTTSWGAPDLQGIWGDDYYIPLQRPTRYANKEFFTDEERAALDNERAAMPRNDARLAPRGTEQDVGSAYNEVFFSLKHTGRRTSLIVDPPDGRMPPSTPDVQRRRSAMREFQLALLQATDVCKNKLAGCAGGKYGPPSPRRAETPPSYLVTAAVVGGDAINRADGPEERGLAERCMGAMLPDFGGFRQIVQSREAVSIFYDTGQGQGWQRIIPVTDRPHLPAHVRQWWGDSRGRWEGNTLVVDVTNFSPKTDFRGSRENLHLVERWTRLDANTLEYIVTLEDMTAWTRPWTVKQELNKQSDEANRFYKEPRCHEGNHGMPGLLAGARAEEKAFAEGRGPHPATRCNAGCGIGLEGVDDPLAN